MIQIDFVFLSNCSLLLGHVGEFSHIFFSMYVHLNNVPVIFSKIGKTKLVSKSDTKANQYSFVLRMICFLKTVKY